MQHKKINQICRSGVGGRLLEKAPQEDKHTPLDVLALGSFLHWKLGISGWLEHLPCLLPAFPFVFLGGREIPKIKI